jgi:hypothetical protein
MEACFLIRALISFHKLRDLNGLSLKETGVCSVVQLFTLEEEVVAASGDLFPALGTVNGARCVSREAVMTSVGLASGNHTTKAVLEVVVSVSKHYTVVSGIRTEISTVRRVTVACREVNPGKGRMVINPELLSFCHRETLVVDKSLEIGRVHVDGIDFEYGALFAVGRCALTHTLDH